MAHELYTAADFNEYERETGNPLYKAVVEGGTRVCKRCGAAEAEVDFYKSCEAMNEHRRYVRARRTARPNLWRQA